MLLVGTGTDTLTTFVDPDTKIVNCLDTGVLPATAPPPIATKTLTTTSSASLPSASPIIVWASNPAQASPASGYSLSFLNGGLVWRSAANTVLFSALYTPVVTPPAATLYTKAVPSVNYVNTIASGQTLNSDCTWGCSLNNQANGEFLMLTQDCVLVLYSASVVPKWTAPYPYQGTGQGCFMAAQTNGQLVVYKTVNGAAVQVWASNTAPANTSASYTLSFLNGGLVWRSAANTVLFSALYTPVVTPPAATLYTKAVPSVNYVNTIASGQTLNSDCTWGCSLNNQANGEFLMLTQDCVLVLYSASVVPKWTAPYPYQGTGQGCFMAAQTNGQLVVYKTVNGAAVQVWASNTAPANTSASYTLSFLNGQVLWRDSSNAVLFSSTASSTLMKRAPGDLYTIAAPSRNYVGVIASGQTLNSDCTWGCSLTNPANGDFLMLTQDYVLVIFTAAVVPKWQAPYPYQGPGKNCFLAAQTNGQLVVYRTQ